jgi:hypothetical protein
MAMPPADGSVSYGVRPFVRVLREIALEGRASVNSTLVIGACRRAQQGAMKGGRYNRGR